jgi:hypothetical protein
MDAYFRWYLLDLLGDGGNGLFSDRFRAYRVEPHKDERHLLVLAHQRGLGQFVGVGGGEDHIHRFRSVGAREPGGELRDGLGCRSLVDA